MGTLLLVSFIAMPIAEIAVFIEAGGRFGLWPTVAAVILTAVVGTALLRAQGLAVLRRAQGSLNRGEMPLQEVFDGFCLVSAGLLLLTPGFITDTLGFALLIPPVRAAIRAWAAARLVTHVHMRTTTERRGPDGSVVIDGEYDEVVDPHAPHAPDDAAPPRIDDGRDGRHG